MTVHAGPKDATQLLTEWRDYWTAHSELGLARMTQTALDEINLLRSHIATLEEAQEWMLIETPPETGDTLILADDDGSWAGPWPMMAQRPSRVMRMPKYWLPLPKPPESQAMRTRKRSLAR